MNWKALMSVQRLGEKKKTDAFSSQKLRSEFEVDYDRIIFSRPFRNLQDKTQVFPLPDQDFVHTRLTHSLEVSSVGRSLGKNAGAALLEKYPELDHLTPGDFGAVVGAAALAHDVGNPPFGHSGETAISDIFQHHPISDQLKQSMRPEEWADLTDFEGNAQGFRLLTRNQRQGLKLTLATLAAFTKYPCYSAFEQRDKKKKSQKKYGYFQSEAEIFEDMAQDLGLLQVAEKVWTRHPLAFLVEAADDICYSIIDLEDGFGLGLVSFEQTKNFLASILKEKFQPAKLEKIPSDKEKIGVLRAVAIHTLIEESTQVFLQNEEAMLAGQFDQAITDLIPSADILEEISKFSIKNLYQSRQVLEKEAAGFEVIDGLLESFILAVYFKYYDQASYSGKHKSIFRLLPEDIVYRLDHEAKSPYQSMLLITDYVSGMTDGSAIKLFRILKGIDLN
ncbi:deoxyguanosinetriphosphate triphosphohydrolase [Reichenbachiella ulvae]|uniref:Deoxyguanosinetriphosphate triphosphohydrolase n=1 Tax=Reichenbachiella ulvae TaxID=2980104 RepID=A0ABT3CVT7_9BACT|nr:deoxyguanosinetriphosphate triphosphohydrolase [Reichenbachiella ulvae]MCV9387816.1 deoxyguanosinetriphosphate triphosphohydrolase [Reichenbachiella ulvae]